MGAYDLRSYSCLAKAEGSCFGVVQVDLADGTSRERKATPKLQSTRKAPVVKILGGPRVPSLNSMNQATRLQRQKMYIEGVRGDNASLLEEKPGPGQYQTIQLTPVVYGQEHIYSIPRAKRFPEHPASALEQGRSHMQVRCKSRGCACSPGRKTIDSDIKI